MKNWNKFIEACKKFYQVNGNLEIRTSSVVDGYELGKQAARVRRGLTSLTDSQRKELNAMGFDFDWTERAIIPFEMFYDYLVGYKAKNGNLDVKSKYVTDDGIHLGRICTSIRAGNRTLTPKQREKLDQLGFLWTKKRGNPNFIKKSPEESKSKVEEPQTSTTQEEIVQAEASEHTEYYVFDTSISSEINKWMKLFDEIISKKAKLVLTSVVLNELSSLRSRVPETMNSFGARRLLARCVDLEMAGDLICHKIDAPETMLHDDAIIKHCIDNGYYLITSDIPMYFKARMESNKVIYIKKEVSTSKENFGMSNNTKLTSSESSEIKPVHGMIPGVRMDKGRLVIDNFTSQGYFLKVIRNERWLENSPAILEVNDEILVVVKSSTNDLVLQHFQIVAITENNNSVMIKRMVLPNNSFFISRMNNSRYREVLFEFINRLKDRAAL